MADRHDASSSSEAAALHQLRNEIKTLRLELNTATASISALKAEFRREIASLRASQSAPGPAQADPEPTAGALVLSQQQHQELVLAVTNQASTQIMKNVVGKLVPVIKNYVDEKHADVQAQMQSQQELINYHTMDGDSLIDGFRRRVCKTSDVKLLTDERSGKRVLRQHVETVFDDDQDWD